MSNKARIREQAKKLNPIDDLMFRKMAEDINFCEEILRVIMQDPELTVLESTPQFSGTNLQGRSVIMDAKCRTGSGKEVNIEVQQANVKDEAYNNKFPHTSENKHRYKMTEGGQQIILKIMESIREEGKREGLMEGLNEGRKEGKKEVALRMHSKGIADDLIAEMADVSVEQVRIWFSEKQA